MRGVNRKWETVIGLEVHVQLDTGGKLFSNEHVKYNTEPNSQVSPYTLGLPGTLPVINKKAVEKALLLALALRSNINHQSTFDRKNYFYPDLPKGYQITQYFNPLAKGGLIPLDYSLSRVIQIRQIHLEEDAGKTIHGTQTSQVDYNRCGTPLAEIVTKPELRSPVEAVQLVKQVQQIVTYLGINSGILAHGVIRCDANISLRKVGEFRKGKKVEIKNLNSLTALKNALLFEMERQKKLLESGAEIEEDTRLWDSSQNKTIVMRSKENELDYRYFPDPDLPPLILDDQLMNQVNIIPELAHERGRRYLYDFGLDEATVDQLVSTRESAEYFESVIGDEANKDFVNQVIKWLNGPVREDLNKNKIMLSEYTVSAKKLRDFITIILREELVDSQARLFFSEIKDSPDDVNKKYEIFIREKAGIGIIHNEEIEAFLKNYPEEIKKYRNGKTQLIGFFVGQFMKKNPGFIDPGKLKMRLQTILDSADYTSNRPLM